MSGTLIVLEGLDGSGKATQSKKLATYFSDQKIPSKLVTFPDYTSPASAPIRMYLAGELGSLDEINAYQASTFYAVDRMVSYKTKWQEDYRQGKTILADRYTTSNAIYQMAKLPEEEWEEYLSWLWDYEFTRLELPEPTMVLYLDVEPEISQTLMEGRYGGDLSRRDLHEENLAYLCRCRQAAFFAMEYFGWHKISATQQGQIRPVSAIFEDIITLLRNCSLL